MKRWTVWCGALALALALAACGRDEPAPEPTAAPEPAPALTATPETAESAAPANTATPAPTAAPDLEALAELARQAGLEALAGLPELPAPPDTASLQAGLEGLLAGQDGAGWNADAYWIACLDDSACTLHIGAGGFTLARYTLDEGGAIAVSELSGQPVLDENGFSVVDGNGEPLLAFGWELLAEDGDGLPRLDLESRSGEALPAGELSFYMTSAASAEEADALARGYLENRQTPDPATDDMTTLLAGYRGVSIVDACILNGLDPSLENRATYAAHFGIEGYRGTPEQNLYLLTCMGGTIA